MIILATGFPKFHNKLIGLFKKPLHAPFSGYTPQWNDREDKLTITVASDNPLIVHMLTITGVSKKILDDARDDDVDAVFRHIEKWVGNGGGQYTVSLK